MLNIGLNLIHKMFFFLQFFFLYPAKCTLRPRRNRNIIVTNYTHARAIRPRSMSAFAIITIISTRSPFAYFPDRLCGYTSHHMNNLRDENAWRKRTLLPKRINGWWTFFFTIYYTTIDIIVPSFERDYTFFFLFTLPKDSSNLFLSWISPYVLPLSSKNHLGTF